MYDITVVIHSRRLVIASLICRGFQGIQGPIELMIVSLENLPYIQHSDSGEISRQ
jgi:hypothetical protein